MPRGAQGDGLETATALRETVAYAGTQVDRLGSTAGSIVDLLVSFHSTQLEQMVCLFLRCAKAQHC